MAFFADKTEDLVYRLRISPDGTPEVLYISRSVRSILGYDPDEFYQNPSLLFSLLPPEERGFFEGIDGGEGECAWPLSFIRSDGSTRFIETKNVIHPDHVTGSLRQPRIWHHDGDEAILCEDDGAGFRIRVPHGRWRKEIYINPPAS